MADDGRRGRIPMKVDVYLTKAELAVRWKVTTKTIETWVKEELCPKPDKLGKRRVRWKLTKIVAHEEAPK